MLDIDYSGCSDFWDSKNKRSLTVQEAVEEGYFETEEEAWDYIESEETDFDE